jgi:hypothetical protein
MPIKYTNNASTTLDGAINNTDTTMDVTSADLFPVLSAGEYFYVTLNSIEIVKVTATSGTEWTIVRGQDNTTGIGHVTGVEVELRINVASIEDTLKDSDLDWSTEGTLNVDGSVTTPTFIGDLNGTINTATTGTTQSPDDNSTKIATTAYIDTAISGFDLWDRVGTTISPKTDGDDINTSGDIEIGNGVFNGTVEVGSTLTVDGDIVPGTPDTYTIGKTDNRFTELWLTGASLHVGNSTVDSTYSFTNTLGTPIYLGGQSGLDDLSSSGTYSNTDATTFQVSIDSVGTPDTFQWRKGTGSWTTGVSITGAAQLLSDGISITFVATTGHKNKDGWIFGAGYRARIDKETALEGVLTVDDDIIIAGSLDALGTINANGDITHNNGDVIINPNENTDTQAFIWRDEDDVEQLRLEWTPNTDILSYSGNADIEFSTNVAINGNDLDMYVVDNLGTQSINFHNDTVQGAVTDFEIRYTDGGVASGSAWLIGDAAMTIESTNSNPLYITSNSTDADPSLILTTTGTNGGRVDISVGDRSPLNNVTPDSDAALYIRDDTTNSAMYFAKDQDSSTWAEIFLLNPDGTATFGSDVSIDGNLNILGTTTSIDTSVIQIASRYGYLNNGYTIDTALSGGLYVNISGSSTVDTVASGGFTAGVDAVSNPTIVTAGTATFTTSDIIQVSSANDIDNNGVYEVLSHAGTLLTVRGIGITSTVEGFSKNQFVADSTAQGDITKITVAILQSASDGTFEQGTGSETGIIYNKIGDVVAGNNTEIQFNNNGAHGASPNLTWDGSEIAITGNATVEGTVQSKASTRGSTDFYLREPVSGLFGNGTYDVIIPGKLVLDRKSSGQFFNILFQTEGQSADSPYDTEWNSSFIGGTSGFSDLSDVKTRTYGTFKAACNGAIGDNVIGLELVMHIISTDQYYKALFTTWGSSTASWTWTRTEISFEDRGLYITDGTDPIFEVDNIHHTVYTGLDVHDYLGVMGDAHFLSDVFINTDQSLLIGASNKETIGGVQGNLQLLGLDDDGTTLTIGRWDGNFSDGAVIQMSNSAGSHIGSDSQLNSNTKLGTIQYFADNQATLYKGAEFYAKCGSFGYGGIVPTDFVWEQADTGVAIRETMRLGSDGTLSVTGDLTTGNLSAISLTRTMPTVIDDIVEIGNFVITGGARSLWVSIVVDSSTFSVAKQYIIPTAYNETGGSWHTVSPISDSGVFSTNNLALDIKVSTNTAYLRIRRTAGSTAGTAYVMIKHEGNIASDTWTATTGTDSVTAPTDYYESAVLTQVDGGVGIYGDLTVGTNALNVNYSTNHVGINTVADATYALDIDGALRCSSTAELSNATNYSGVDMYGTVYVYGQTVNGWSFTSNRSDAGTLANLSFENTSGVAGLQINTTDYANQYGQMVWSTRASDGYLERYGVNSTGDFFVNTDTLYVDYSADEVGIGTTNPKSNLHILTSGTSGLGVTPAGKGVIITGEIGQSRLYFENVSSTAGERVFEIINNTGVLSFDSLNDTAASFVNEHILTLDHNSGDVVVGVGNLTVSAGDTELNGDVTVADGYGLIIGNASRITAGTPSRTQLLGSAGDQDTTLIIGRFTADAYQPRINFVKSRNATIGSHTIVQDGDFLGALKWHADDGVDFDTESASFFAEVDDSSPAAGDIGTAFVWKQMPGGGGAYAETMRLAADGDLTVSAGNAIITTGNIQAYGAGGVNTNFVGGRSSGGSLTIGSLNTITGYLSANNLTEGTQNTLYGHSTGNGLILESFVTAYGSAAAGGNATNLNRAVALGAQALSGASGSQYTVAAGMGAGRDSSSQDSIFLGYQVGEDETANHKLIIGSRINNLIEGSFYDYWMNINSSINTPYGGFGRYQNLCRYSEDLSVSPWIDYLSYVTVVTDNATAPNGTTTADTVTWDTLGRGLRHINLGLVNGQTYTVSFWASAVTQDSQTLEIDLGDGTAGSVAILSGQMRRYSVTLTATANDWMDLEYNGTAGDAFEFWGFQVNDGSIAYNYLKTTDTAISTEGIGASVTGDLRVEGDLNVIAAAGITLDNTSVTGDTTIILGSDTATTSFIVQNNSLSDLFTVDGAGDLTVGTNLTINEAGFVHNSALQAFAIDKTGGENFDFSVYNGGLFNLFVDTGGSVIIDTPELDIEGPTKIHDTQAGDLMGALQLCNDSSTAGSAIGLNFSVQSNDVPKAGIFFENDTGDTNGRGNLYIAVDQVDDTNPVQIGDAVTTFYSDGTVSIPQLREDYNQTSGWLFGGQVTVNAGDNTLIDVAAGTIRLVDYATDTTSRIPEFTTISWTAQTAVDPGTFGRSIWVGVEDNGSGGAQFRFDVGLTPTILRSTGVLCRLLSNTGDGQISSVLDFERPAWGLTNAMQDFILQFGSYTIAGNKFTPNNSNLLLDRGKDDTNKTWRYHTSDTKGAENVHTESESTGITAYNYHLQGNNVTTLETDIEPDYYDNAGTKTAVPSNYWTIQEVWYFPTSGTTHAIYGQVVYDSKVAAVIGLDTESKVRNTEILDGAIFRTYLLIQEGMTNLDEAIIIQEPVTGLPSKGQGRVPTFNSRSYAISDYGANDNFYAAGFYEAPAADTTLTIGGTTTQTLGTSGKAEAAHAFAVFNGGGDASLTLTVSGTSITDTGVRTTSDSEVLATGTQLTDVYYETTKKWLGQVTYTLTGTTGSYTFNYGFAKYEDFGNRDFTVTDFEIVAYTSNTATNMDVELLYHSSTGWTYHATAFVPGGNTICDMATDYSTDRGIGSEEYFSYKRSNLSTDVVGGVSEGVLVRLTQTTNNAIRYGTIQIGVLM